MGSECPLFYRTCGTSSRCVSLTMPGAETTNNPNRGRRLGPRWDRRQSNTQNGHFGVLVEIHSPSKLLDACTREHEVEVRQDNGRVYSPTPADVLLTMPLSAASAPDSSVAVSSKVSSTLFARKRSSLRWRLVISLGALAALIALGEIAWRTRWIPTNSTFVASPTMPNSSSPVAPLGVGQARTVKSSSPGDQHELSQADGHASQPGFDQKLHEPRAAVTTGNELGPQHGLGAKRETAVNANGLVDLANQYLRSEGVPRGCSKAMRLLNRAANGGNVRARNRLASMFAVGSCVRRDPLEAYRWMGAALDIDPHDRWAQQNRELMLRQMTREERSQLRNAD